ncbi:serine protease PepA [Actinoplanes sp. SE50]|uniref:S1C family serine protease n=1 Tax=unclassified Actinoplanes TaxID=2626549 RepID=UPI00023EC7FF|nr:MULTISPECIES: trypsin-like peptidase domain-containing protein [unclassified Actinoplanes]AEV85347.1 serine protease PepA [Actinoplanes sp. SE50/110]ATO83742.1 serine protease PepA [Actinoplanes sp. SE50]SLM01150.1 serine protease PepA [Actinoplanes sp. SE50/110]
MGVNPHEQSPYTPMPPQQYWPQPAPPPRRRPVGALVAGALAALMVTGGAGFAAGWGLRSEPVAQQSTRGSHLPRDPGDGASSSAGATDAQVAAVAAKVDPALVDIDTVLGAQNGAAAGTGIVIGADGIVLTNNHVIAGATAITVTDIGDHRAYRAAVVGYDRARDIAVLHLDGASGLATATLAESTPVRQGDPVVAIGNAGGAGGTPGAVGGVVAALHRSITAQDASSGASEQLTDLIEVNAAIRPGDSGGPLLTTDGTVIGVDTAASTGFRYPASGGAGYAIPIDAAMSIVRQIQAGQASDGSHLGATGYLGIGAADGAGGAAVRSVVRGSPAASAGLARGDTITAVDGARVGSAAALIERLDRHHPGDRVKLSWTDTAGRTRSGTVALASGPVG